MTSSIKDRFKTNSRLASEGVNIRFSNLKNSDGTIPSFKITRSSGQNKKWLEDCRRINNKYLADKGVTELKDLSPEQVREINVISFCESVLVGWENFEPENDGVKLQYSKENAMKLFGNDDWRDFMDELTFQSNNIENFKAKLVEDITKN